MIGVYIKLGVIYYMQTEITVLDECYISSLRIHMHNHCSKIPSSPGATVLYPNRIVSAKRKYLRFGWYEIENTCFLAEDGFKSCVKG